MLKSALRSCPSLLVLDLRLLHHTRTQGSRDQDSARLTQLPRNYSGRAEQPEELLNRMYNQSGFQADPQVRTSTANHADSTTTLTRTLLEFVRNRSVS